MEFKYAFLERMHKELSEAKNRGLFDKKYFTEKEWTDMLSASFPEMDVYYDSLSFSISCHIGPGGYGVGISVIGEYDL